MDFRDKLRKAAEQLGKVPTEDPKPEPAGSDPIVEGVESNIQQATLSDGTTVKVGDRLQISLLTGEVMATPVIEQIFSDSEVIADGEYIENIKIPQITKLV